MSLTWKKIGVFLSLATCIGFTASGSAADLAETFTPNQDFLAEVLELGFEESGKDSSEADWASQKNHQLPDFLTTAFLLPYINSQPPPVTHYQSGIRAPPLTL